MLGLVMAAAYATWPSPYHQRRKHIPMSLEHAPTDDASATEARPSRFMAALCGVLAGALSLGVAELIAGLVAGAPSPVLSIGALLISIQPPGAKDFVVNLFGTNDK